LTNESAKEDMYPLLAGWTEDLNNGHKIKAVHETKYQKIPREIIIYMTT
jgi:hypothetical protein